MCSSDLALLPSVESGVVTLVGATTENPYFEVNAPLRSRSTLFRLEPLARGDVRELLVRALDAESAEAEDGAVDAIADRCGGDARQALTTLEVAGERPCCRRLRGERASRFRSLAFRRGDSRESFFQGQGRFACMFLRRTG